MSVMKAVYPACPPELALPATALRNQTLIPHYHANRKLEQQCHIADDWGGGPTPAHLLQAAWWVNLELWPMANHHLMMRIGIPI